MIELLVVIAIIALLAALLMPALKSARDKARNIACVSNARQLGLAMVLYAGDFNDTLRPGFWNTGGAPSEWHRNLAPYVGATDDRFMRAIFACPAARLLAVTKVGQRWDLSNGSNDPNVNGRYWVSYIVPMPTAGNQRDSNPANRYFTRLSGVGQQWPLFFERYDGRPGSAGDAGVSGIEAQQDLSQWKDPLLMLTDEPALLETRHNNRLTQNVTFTDGHVEPFTGNRILEIFLASAAAGSNYNRWRYVVENFQR